MIRWIRKRRIGKRGAAGRRGSVLIVTAVAAVPLMLGAGVAVDATRMWLVRGRIQDAVDAAALMAAYETGVSTQVADAKALFWVNFSSNAASTGKGFFNTTSPGATVTQVDSAHVQVSAQANMPLSIMRLGNSGSVTVPSATAIAAKGSGYEIALALDITGSMLNASGSNSLTKEQALQNAAADFLDTVYGNGDTVTNLSVSVVPFRGSVNVGTANKSWLSSSGYTASNWTAQAWRGCVQARTGGSDVTEDNPGTAGFSALYWASTYTQQSGDYGDNDWYSGSVTDTGNGVSSTSKWSGLPVGPNLGCSNGVVLPLTASKASVKNEITGLVAASGGSTVISQGLQWAWFTLSPVWQGYWGLSASQTGASRPLAYSTANNYKVVILMTDGNDEWDGNQQTSQNLNCGSYAVMPECVKADGYVNSYGRLSDNRLGIAMPANGTSRSTNAAASNTASTRAATALDSKTSTVCTAMKNKGVIIYTIAFQAAAGSDAETVLKGCATDSSHYYNTNTGNDIDVAFTSIGQQLVNLRLTQ